MRGSIVAEFPEKQGRAGLDRDSMLRMQCHHED